MSQTTGLTIGLDQMILWTLVAFGVLIALIVLLRNR
jgi:hypothetical protein